MTNPPQQRPPAGPVAALCLMAFAILAALGWAPAAQAGPALPTTAALDLG